MKRYGTTISIVADGQRRSYNAYIAQVRAEVEAKRADELAAAGLWRRWQIRREIEREIEQRMAKLAPKDWLY